MYQPQDRENPTYPVPKKVNGRIVSFISGRCAAAVAAVAVVAFLAYGYVGTLTIEATRDTTEYERTEALTQYKQDRAVLVCDGAREELASLEDSRGLVRGDLTDEQKARHTELSKEYANASMTAVALTDAGKQEARDEAAGLGITAKSTDADLEALVPLTKSESEPRVEQTTRIVCCLLLPIGTALALVVEPMGMQSVSSLIGDNVQYARRRHLYLYRRAAGKDTDGD